MQMYRSLAQQRIVWLYFIAIFAYLGCETGNRRLDLQISFSVHGFDPHTSGAMAVSWFWGLLTVGCFIGMFLLKLFDCRRVLIGASAGALLSLSAALFGRQSLRSLRCRSSDCFGYVADRVLVGAEFRKGLSRFFRRDSQHGHCRGHNRATRHGTARRSVWTARRTDVFVCYLRHHRQCGSGQNPSSTMPHLVRTTAGAPTIA